jgi:hypothetical protein
MVKRRSVWVPTVWLLTPVVGFLGHRLEKTI